jgi:hypothetical protein
VQGEGGIYAQDTAGVSDAPFRVEGFFSESGIQDMGTLQWIGGQRLNANNHNLSEHTYEIGDLNNPKTPKPWDDYYLGDWIWGRTKSVKEALRIAQITLSESDDGTRSGSVVLGDLIEEKALRLNQKIDRVEQSIVNRNSSGGNISTLDATTPKAPTNMVVTTDSYQDTNGTTRALLLISWTQVTQNTDNTPYTDAGGYRLQWKRTADGGWGEDWTTTPDAFQTTISGLPLGVSVDVRLRAYDLSGHLSTWVQQTVVTSKDTVPPNAPSAPTVDTTKFAGVARIIWDGLDYLGAPMPPDFAAIEVHVDNVAGFAVTDANRTDIVPIGGGISVYAGDMGVQRYVKLVAVDRAGNKSAPSAEVAFTIRKLVDTDAIDAFVTNRLLGPQVVDTANIKDLAVGTAQMKDLAVVNAKIGTLAVNDANIASMSVGKLAAGTLSADITVSARIKTADTGARTEINSTGLHVFNASNQEVLTAAVVGGTPTILVQGTFQTATSGSRVVITPSGTYANSILFYTGAGGETGPSQVIGSTTFFGAGLVLTSPTVTGTNGGNAMQVILLPGGVSNPMGTALVLGTIQVNTLNASAMGLLINAAAGQNVSLARGVDSGSTIIFNVNNAGRVQGWGTYVDLSASNQVLKKNIDTKPYPDALDRVRKITPARFQYKKGPQNKHLGFLAENVQALVPEAVVDISEVSDDKERTSTIVERPLIALTMAAVQQMAEELDALKARVKELEGV